MTTVRPPWWEPEDFQRDLDRAVELFRARRLKEPVDQYRREFDEAMERVETLLRNTDNLIGTLPDAPNAPEVALGLLADRELRVALRYLAGPPISEDDLKTLAEAPSLAPSRLSGDKAMVQRIMAVLHESIDTKRFPWVPVRSRNRPMTKTCMPQSSRQRVSSPHSAYRQPAAIPTRNVKKEGCRDT